MIKMVTDMQNIGKDKPFNMYEAWESPSEAFIFAIVGQLYDIVGNSYVFVFLILYIYNNLM